LQSCSRRRGLRAPPQGGRRRRLQCPAGRRSRTPGGPDLVHAATV